VLTLVARGVRFGRRWVLRRSPPVARIRSAAIPNPQSAAVEVVATVGGVRVRRRRGERLLLRWR
jgi:hypothetical protein